MLVSVSYTSTIISCFKFEQAQTIPRVNESLQTQQSATAGEHENESVPLCFCVRLCVRGIHVN